MKKNLFIYLSILLLGVVVISSCQDAGQDDLLVQELLEINKGKELSEYESKLKELSLFMGEVLKDYEARKELFEFILVPEITL